MRHMSRTRLVSNALFLAFLAPLGAAAASTGAPDCSKLLGLKLKDTVITEAAVIPAKGDVPEYCRVQGGLETVILFEVALPTTAWNNKFFYVGGAGYNGSVPELTDALARGYAAAGSDTGHRGFHWDASAMYDNPQAQVNYAHRATHLVALLAKQMVQAYYGAPPRRSYFCGCSNGGKMALMEVERYPVDFDGVVAGGAVVDRTKAMIMFDWTQRALLGSEIPPSKVPAMEKATLAACDAKDGLADGLIDRPDKCEFDPKVLTCAGSDGPNCLTPKQVAAWKKILEGPVTSTGKRLYVGYSPGHEGDYPYYITGVGTMHGYPSSNFMYMDSFMRWIVFGPKFDSVRSFDYDKDPEALVPFEKDQDADFLNPVPIRLVHDHSVSKFTAPWAATLSEIKQRSKRPMEKVFEIYIRTTPERLCEAITNHTTRAKFQFGCHIDSDWTTGSRYELSNPRAADLISEGVNLIVEPPLRLVQSFVALCNDNARAEGTSRVTWEIETISDSCRLTVTHDQLREGADEAIYGGWPMILSGLKSWIETGAVLTTPGSLAYG